MARCSDVCYGKCYLLARFMALRIRDVVSSVMAFAVESGLCAVEWRFAEEF